ncbi:glycosyltransferase family 4 protein [Thermus sp.]|jgi:glycosyltransferase involved in cell wall biosynthesis|uniref:glycosyltransferase family 4 protein n=1 Tax=Thermus sp. TaxID=275 RepID=UPI0032200DF3
MTKAKRVLHLSTVHPVLDTRIFHKEAQSLAQAGYEVVLVAQGQPKESEGIRIHGLPTPKNRFSRMFGTTFKALSLAVRERADIYHFHDPELIPVGLLLRLMGKKVIYDVHEDLPRQILSKYWIPSVLRGVVAKAAELMEWVAGRFMNGIVAATPAIAERFPPHKTVVVQNFPLLSEFPHAGEIPYSERPMQVVYVGGISAIRGVIEIVKAMEHLPPRLGARLFLAGRFDPPELESRLQEMPGWHRTVFMGWLSRKEIRTLLARSRVGLVILHPTLNYVAGQPVKLFEYMAAGIPVVASNFPLWREIVEGEQCGLTVDPLNPKEIAKAIQWLLEHPQEAEEMGKRGRKAVLERFNWEQEAEKLLAFYRRIV